MSRIYFPGCKVKNRYPEASAWLAEQVLARGLADEITGCCRVNRQKLTPEDTAVCICNNCMSMIDNDADNGALDSIWAIIDADPDFPLPNYAGLVMGIQDCRGARNRTDVQDAVRSLMRKMGIKVVELPDARGESHFCGVSYLKALSEYGVGASQCSRERDAQQGTAIPSELKAMQNELEEHCAAIEPDQVACYCFACDIGLEAGGKDAVNILELISGKFRTGE